MRAWVIVAALGAACTEVHGRIDSSGGPLGDFAFLADDCGSGLGRGFYGVTLFDHSDESRRVRVVDDVLRGKVVVVEAPGMDSPGLELTPAQCRQFDLDVTVDECDGYEGHVAIDCDVTVPAQIGQNAPMPGRLRGRVTFEHCN